MEFWVKVIEVLETENGEAREDLQANCTHVARGYWLFEGDEDALHPGIKFEIIGEEAIEGTGDMTGDQLRTLLIETYNIDKAFL